MPKVSQTYSSGNWLKASTFSENGIDQVVFGISEAQLQDCKTFHGDIKKAIVLTLEGPNTSKKWELNKTNAEIIKNYLGDDTDDWIGKEVGVKLVRGVRFSFGIADVLEAFNPLPQPEASNTEVHPEDGLPF